MACVSYSLYQFFRGKGIIIMNTFQITQKLHTVYPDIEEELCTKHSALLSSLSQSFAKAYPLYSPTHFIVAKQPLVLVKGKKWQIQMAMEQAVTLVVAASDQKEKMNIWTQAKEQIVMENSGKIINVQSQQRLTVLASRAISLAVQDLSLSKVRGGFIYFYLPPICDLSSIQTVSSILIAFFMATITINNLIEEYSINDLINKLKTLKQFKHNKMAQNYFENYRNRQLLVSGPNIKNIEVDRKYKFLFMSLSLFDQAVSLPTSMENQVDALIQELGQNKFTWIEMMNQLSQLSLKEQNNPSNSFIKSLQTQFNINAAFYTHKYCVLIVQSCRYTEIISKLSKIIHSKLQQREQGPEEDILYSKSQAAHSRSKMQSLLLSSMPSTGISIIDPSSSIWL